LPSKIFFVGNRIEKGGFYLAGAMAELKRKPDKAVFLESWITNSDKVFAVFSPPPR